MVAKKRALLAQHNAEYGYEVDFETALRRTLAAHRIEDGEAGCRKALEWIEAYMATNGRGVDLWILMLAFIGTYLHAGEHYDYESELPNPRAAILFDHYPELCKMLFYVHYAMFDAAVTNPFKKQMVEALVFDVMRQLFSSNCADLMRSKQVHERLKKLHTAPSSRPYFNDALFIMACMCNHRTRVNELIGICKQALSAHWLAQVIDSRYLAGTPEGVVTQCMAMRVLFAFEDAQPQRSAAEIELICMNMARRMVGMDGKMATLAFELLLFPVGHRFIERIDMPSSFYSSAAAATGEFKIPNHVIAAFCMCSRGLIKTGVCRGSDFDEMQQRLMQAGVSRTLRSLVLAYGIYIARKK